MIILVSGATKTVANYPACGRLISPRGGNSIQKIASSGRYWAADNDAFLAWDQERFWKMLGKITKVDCSRFLWVACPDVVGNAQETINRWIEWYPQLNAIGLPAAFVGQDGLESIPDQIPWHEMSAFFVGGSTEWKLSIVVEQFCREARNRGKWIHIGRVNTLRRIRHAVEIEADSIDGTTFSRYSETYIPRALNRIKNLEKQKHFLF